MGVLTTISETLGNLFREGCFAEVATEIQRSEVFVRSLGAGVFWSSLDFLYASKKEKQVPLRIYIAKGKKEIAPAQNSGKNVSR